MNKYFSKDWKFFWRQDSLIGNWYGVFLNRFGVLLLNLSRKLIRKGGGTFRGKHYSNCSWCGDDGYGRCDTSYSHVGARCMSRHKTCDNQPKV